MRIRTSREKRIYYFKTVIRWILYYIVILLGFSVMTAGSWLKPVILVPVALAIAVDNNILASVFTGGFCGLLTDIACGRLFGFNAVMLAVLCMAFSLIYQLWLRSRMLNFIWTSSIAAYIQCRLDYEFYYRIWGYADVENIFVHTTLRVWAYTVISAVFVWLVIRLINSFFMPRTHITVGEAIKAGA